MSLHDEGPAKCKVNNYSDRGCLLHKVCVTPIPCSHQVPNRCHTSETCHDQAMAAKQSPVYMVPGGTVPSLPWNHTAILEGGEGG